jgi:TetR/AcrR family transcriptional regulator, ethionamide resistance regulator
MAMPFRSRRLDYATYVVSTDSYNETPRSPSQAAAIAKSPGERIIAALGDAVIRILASGDSFREVSVADLVHEAGISRATFYRHFADKGDVLRALARGSLSQIIDAAERWYRLPPSAGRAELREALHHLIDAYRSNAPLIAAVQETAPFDAAVRGEYEAMISRLEQGVADHIAEAQRAQRISANLDGPTTAQWLLRMLERGAYQLIPGATDVTVDTLEEALTTIVWNSLYREAQT